MKKYLFLLVVPIIFLFPGNVFAAEPIDDISSYEFYWSAMNSSTGVVDSARSELRPIDQMKMGISGAEYSLIRIGPLLRYNGLGYNATYSADVLFYIETHEPFDLVNPSCSLWSANGETSSCTLNKLSEVQVDSTKVLVTYKASYNWTSSSNYVEFTLNFGSTSVRPNETTFFYQVNDFYGNVSDSQIVVDGLEETNKKLDEAEKTRKGILETIKELPNMFLDMLKSLFIPEDMSFLDEFKDSLANKLGFIAEVPLTILDFLFGLASAGWDEFNSITFPSIEIFGVNFWNEMEIDLSEAKGIFEPFKFYTDIACVILCVNTLRKWYDNFASGGGS